MWSRVRKALKGLDPVRIENRVELGTPDVNYIQGWIELKIAKAPKRETTILFIDHYTKEQETWAIRRKHAGGKIFLLLKVDNEWMIFDGAVAARYLNKTTLQELRKVAIRTWKIKLIDNELREILLSN